MTAGKTLSDLEYAYYDAVVQGNGSLAGSTTGATVGAAANGAAVTGNPVLIAGQDGTNVQSVLTDTSGRLITSSVASKAEDSLHVSGDMGTVILAVRESTPTDLSAGGTDGDYEPLQVDATGRLWVNASAIASGAADSGNPVKVGAKYNSTQPTFTDGQRGDLQIGSKGSLRVELFGSGSTNSATVSTTTTDGNSTGVGVLFNATYPYSYNGSSWDRVRSPSKFFTATATASGDTALWTPTAGKKFRLMRYMIQATADVAVAAGAEVDVVLRDATTGLAASISFYAPAVSVTSNPGSTGGQWVDLGNGILSATANNVLNINLSATLTSGKVRVVCCGVEE